MYIYVFAHPYTSFIAQFGMPITIPKFIHAKTADPKFSTEDYWHRFQYSIIWTIKTKPDDLLKKQSQATATDATFSVSDDEKVYPEILKEALGEETVFEIQQRNPKHKVYQQEIKWIKERWEECFKTNKNVTENLVRLWNGTKSKYTTVLQHWLAQWNSTR